MSLRIGRRDATEALDDRLADEARGEAGQRPEAEAEERHQGKSGPEHQRPERHDEQAEQAIERRADEGVCRAPSIQGPRRTTGWPRIHPNSEGGTAGTTRCAY